MSPKIVRRQRLEADSNLISQLPTPYPCAYKVENIVLRDGREKAEKEKIRLTTVASHLLNVSEACNGMWNGIFLQSNIGRECSKERKILEASAVITDLPSRLLTVSLYDYIVADHLVEVSCPSPNKRPFSL